MSRIETDSTQDTRPFGFMARFAVGALATALLPPFIMLAIAPMLLVLAPVALVAIPFMLSAFAGAARPPAPAPQRLRVLRPAVS